MKKIVALNSGGFDSVCLMHYLREEFPEAEIHSLFFNYGQPNLEGEKLATKKIVNKVNAVHKELALPSMDWSSGDFFSGEYREDEGVKYLEYRNLIFASFAISYAEGIGAEEIYMAMIKSYYGYSDCSLEFFAGLNSLLSIKSKVRILTPFIEYEKDELIPIALRNRMTSKDYFSCNTPVDGMPCSRCGDCMALSTIRESIEIDSPAKEWGLTYDPYNSNFQRLVEESRVKELRAFINTIGQVGFDPSFLLSPKKYLGALKDAIKLGVTNIQFSGKEPLYNDLMFWYVQELKKFNPLTTFEVATDGLNVPKYAHLLKKWGFKKVYLGVNDYTMENGVLREGILDSALYSLSGHSIPVCMHINLSKANFKEVRDTVLHLRSAYFVTSFQVSTATQIGKADFEPLSPSELNWVFLQLRDQCLKGCEVTFNLGVKSTYDLISLQEPLPLSEAIDTLLSYGTSCYERWLDINVELYCGKYDRQVILTPDGCLLGCTSDLSTGNYVELSAGNVKDYSVADLIKRGKNMCVEINCKEVDSEGKLIFKDCTNCSRN